MSLVHRDCLALKTGKESHCMQVKNPAVGVSLWKDPEQLPPGLWERGEDECVSRGGTPVMFKVFSEKIRQVFSQ